MFWSYYGQFFEIVLSVLRKAVRSDKEKSESKSKHKTLLYKSSGILFLPLMKYKILLTAPQLLVAS